MRARTYFANVLVVALSLALCSHFFLIAIYGGYRILEPSLFILSLEIAILFGFISFAISNIVKLVRGK